MQHPGYPPLVQTGNGHVPPVSGKLWLYEGKRGATWYLKARRPMRLPDGRVVTRQQNIRIGPAWVPGRSGRGRCPDEFLTERAARVERERVLTEIRDAAIIEASPRVVTVKDAAEAWFAWGENEKGWKPATRRDYRSALNVHLIGTEDAPGPFRDVPVSQVTAALIEEWRSHALADGLPRRTAIKLLAILHGIFERARRRYGLPSNPVADVEKLRERYRPEAYSFYSPEDVWALVRETEHPSDETPPCPQDAAIFLTAAFTGLRLGELLALRVRDIDFEADAIRVMGSVDPVEGVGTTKSGRGRSVPMVEEVAQALARLLQREHFIGLDDFVFVSGSGGHLDGSALRRRYRAAQKRAGLDALRLHDLRHTFGSLAINRGSTVQVQAWMGHADARTTARYLHYKRRTDEAKLLAGAFAMENANTTLAAPNRPA
jgi:integrase